MSKEIRMIKGKLYKEECVGNWEPMETTAVNDAGVAYRAIQRLLLSITDDEIKRADLMRPELNPLIEAMDTLQAIKDIEKQSLEKELRPNSWTEAAAGPYNQNEWKDAANADGYLFNEYNEIEK
ncbi:hypothetical protein [uncultured Mediterranean phage]|nr:hypothetical protein [uncultured Mediterranean phage]